MFQTLWGALKDFFNVLKRRKEPKDTCILMHLKCLRLFGLSLLNSGEESLIYKVYNKVVIFVLSVFAFMLTWGLYDSMSSLDDFLESVCVLLGVYLILFKVIRFQNLRKEIECVVLFFNNRSQCVDNEGDAFRKELHRKYFLRQAAILFLFTLLGFILYIAVTFQPLFSGSFTLPFHAKCPFGTYYGSNGYIAAYMFQSICTWYIINHIVFVDGTSTACIDHICLQLEILCRNFMKLGKNGNNQKNIVYELRQLVKEHQTIIGLTDYINRTQHSMFVAQVICSISIFCLTAFEITVAREFSSRFKFAWYMLAAFLQMLNWCMFGTKVNYQSTKLADAVFHSLWRDCPERIKKDLCFVILRAQKPLAIKASPFYDFNFQSLLSILRSSYSYFTLLCILTNK